MLVTLKSKFLEIISSNCSSGKVEVPNVSIKIEIGLTQPIAYETPISHF